MILAGADGCKAGWVVVSAETHGSTLRVERAHLVSELIELTGLLPRLEILAIDIPIGLEERVRRGGRACDRAARAHIGRRRSSVFSAPSSVVLGCASYREALLAQRAISPDGVGLTKQCWNIVPKVREADAFVGLAPFRVVEAHPEVSFTEMTGAPMAFPKRTREGLRERTRALNAARVEPPSGEAGCARDDLLDACACLWSAWRVGRGIALRLPVDGDEGQPAIYA